LYTKKRKEKNAQEGGGEGVKENGPTAHEDSLTTEVLKKENSLGLGRREIVNLRREDCGREGGHDLVSAKKKRRSTSSRKGVRMTS